MALAHRIKDARNLRGEFVTGFRLDFGNGNVGNGVQRANASLV